MTAKHPETDTPASALPRQAPVDRTIKLLLSAIAVALTLIALRPFIAPIPAQAQTRETAAAAASSSFIAILDRKDQEPTALVSYKGSQGQPMVAALVFRGKWYLSDGIKLPN